MTDLAARIAAYLSSGGLFNPELANHDAVRDLIIDCRARIEELEKALEDISKLPDGRADEASVDAARALKGETS
jgi:hypothetical protein